MLSRAHTDSAMFNIDPAYSAEGQYPIEFPGKAVEPPSDVDDFTISNGSLDNATNRISMLAKPNQHIRIREDSRL